MIPYHVLRRKDLSDKAKLVYGFIQGFFDGDCRASNEFVGRLLATTPRTIQRAVTELLNKRLVRRNIVTKDNRIVGRILIINKGNKITPKDDF